MPEVICSRSIKADVQTLWEFVENIDNWAPFIMGYQKHETIDDLHSNWTVKGELGALARTVNFDVAITEWAAPDKVTFTIKGITETFAGNGAFYIGPNDLIPLEDVDEQRAKNVGTKRPGVLRRLWDLIFYRGRAGTESVDSLSTTGAEAIAVSLAANDAAEQTQFTFTLTLNAGGMTAPVVNVMLEPLMRRAADEFAERLIEELLRRAAA